MSVTELDRALHKQVLKREADKERLYREERAKRDAEVHLGFGATEMSKEELRKIIASDCRMYYRTEELNDKLYIHYKGWKQIRGLEGWTGLRALYAECNAFDRIQGLQNCRNLRSLFLSENCIRKIEGLECCPELWSLNLSNNFIERIEGLSTLRRLNTLTIAKNKIGHGGVDDIIELLDTPVSSLDIQDNKIWDPDVLPEVFSRMSDLRVLYLKGNPCGKKIPNYRKSITVYCTNLKYLDDRPVFPEDRRAAEAFNRGGLEEERAERRRIREENNAQHDRNMKAFAAMVEAAKSEKRERTAMRTEDKYTEETDPVESLEQRMKRQVDRWKEEHADEIRDDLREHAERCLKAERESVAEQQPSTTGIFRKETMNNLAESAEGSLGADDTEEPQGASDDKVDNRKLVYEDIWDDFAPAPPKESSKPVFAPPPRRPPPPTALDAGGTQTMGATAGLSRSTGNRHGSDHAVGAPEAPPALASVAGAGTELDEMD